MQSEASQYKSKAEITYQLGTFRVLIVEDFSFIANLIAPALTVMGVGNIIHAKGGNEAREMILEYNAAQSTTNIDIVLLDWLMPEGGGAELLKWIRDHRSETIRFLPVIVCSAYVSQSFVETTRDLGVTEIMVKPVAADKIANRMTHIINSPRHFIKTPDFFGPDRRRKEKPFEKGDRRKTKPEEIKVNYEKLE